MRLALLACVLLAVACGKNRPGIEPRHLLIVTCSALRADRMSAYLAPRPTTSLPATVLERSEGRAFDLDHIAASGVVFATCTTPSPRAEPALASLFTGRVPRSAGVEDDGDRIAADAPTLAELFADSGFRTGAFATRFGDADLEQSLGRGFDEFHAGANDDETLAAALAWLKHDQGDGSRRFTWIHLAGAAPPFDRGSTASAVGEVLATKDFGAGLSSEDLAALKVGTLSVSDANRAADFARTYDREIARTTIALARMLQDAFDYTHDGAEASETWARTVFAFTAPNGLLLGEDGRVGHSESCHEHMTHVPLVLRHPDSLTGERVSSAVVELADLLPTFVEWFDLATPARVDGRSLLALLDSYEKRPFERRPTVSRVGDREVGVRDERWHLVWTKSENAPNRPRLFDPARDPAEREDLAAQNPEIVRRLAARARIEPPSAD